MTRTSAAVLVTAASGASRPGFPPSSPETAERIGGRDAVRSGKGAAGVGEGDEPRGGKSALLGELMQKRGSHLSGSKQRDRDARKFANARCDGLGGSREWKD